MITCPTLRQQVTAVYENDRLSTEAKRRILEDVAGLAQLLADDLDCNLSDTVYIEDRHIAA